MNVGASSVYHGALYDIVLRCGEAVLALIAEMQDDDELFASRNTLAAIEDHLQIMAQTLGNMPPSLQEPLQLIDWNGWRVVHHSLRTGKQPRREVIWYAVCALVPATLALFEHLHRQQPWLFRTA